MASIYKRGNLYWITWRQDGKTLNKSLKTIDFSTAKYLKNQLEMKLGEGKRIPIASKARISNTLPRYLDYLEMNSSPGHVESQRLLINLFLAWSSVTYLSQIKASLFQEYLLFRKKEGRSPVTMKHSLQAVSAFLNWCVINGIALDNPLKRIKAPRIERKPPNFLTKAQAKDLIAAADADIKYMIIISLHTGIRASELLRLDWKDFDFRENLLTIRKSKTGQFRVIPFNPLLKEHLEPTRKPAGRIFHYSKVPRKQFAKVKQKAGLDLNWHALRHTYASNLIMDDVNIVTVSKLLGHSDIQTTMIYAHLTDQHRAEAANHVDY